MRVIEEISVCFLLVVLQSLASRRKIPSEEVDRQVEKYKDAKRSEEIKWALKAGGECPDKGEWRSWQRNYLSYSVLPLSDNRLFPEKADSWEVSFKLNMKVHFLAEVTFSLIYLFL